MPRRRSGCSIWAPAPDACCWRSCASGRSRSGWASTGPRRPLASPAGNARDLGLAARSAFLCGDWAGSISGRFDLVLSNPPYVATAELAAPDAGGRPPRTAHRAGRRGVRIDGLSCHHRRTRRGCSRRPARRCWSLGLANSTLLPRSPARPGSGRSPSATCRELTRAIILHASPLKIPIGTTM